MPITSETKAAINPQNAAPKTNGLTEEQKEALKALAGKWKDKPESMDRLMEEVERYRETLRLEEIKAQENTDGRK